MDHLLDVSQLEPPEPMERVLDALADMPIGDRLVMRHRRQPFPLYDILHRMGYQWRVSGVDGAFEILIWPSDAGSGCASS